MKGYALFYKDKDGFETPLTEFGVLEVHPNESSIEKHKIFMLQKIKDSLIIPTKKYWWSKPPVHVQLKDYQIELYNRIIKTMYVKQISLF